MPSAEFILPVKICNLPFVPAVTQVVQKTLVLSVQADVVRDGKGLLRKAGDAVYHTVLVDMHPEIIPKARLAGYDLHALEQKTGQLWRGNRHLAWHT